MSKIYNEIVIDMNPESHSYMEVLHEDSFEYSGDMMLAQGGNVSYQVGEKIVTEAGRKYFYRVNGKKYYKNPYKYDSSSGSNYYQWEKNKGAKYVEYPVYEWNGKNWLRQAEHGQHTTTQKLYKDIASVPAAMDVESKEWGAANITKDDFIDPSTGKPRSLIEIAKILDPKLPGVTGDKLMNTIKDLAPKYTGVPLEEKQFAKEAMKRDVYGVSKEARKVGAEARSVYGGSAAGMRGAMTGTEDIAKAFEATQQGYQQDLYGLEKGAEKAYEAEVGTFLGGQADWFKTGAGGAKELTDWEDKYAEAKEGGFIHKDGSGVGNNRKFQGGGFVPEEGSSMQSMIDSKLELLDYARGDGSDSSFTDELSSRYGADYGAGSSYHDILSSGLSRNGNGENTFLDLLTQLPEAGGS
mgnify:CR=1 FL=1